LASDPKIFPREKEMVMNRNEIIELLVIRAAPDERQKLRQALSTYTTEELKQIEQAIVSQAVSNVAEDELIHIQAEIAAERELFRLSREPQRKAEAERQEKQDRETFKEAARTLRSFAVNEANFNVCRTTLGEGFSTSQIQEMLAANGATLSPPTQDELNEWTRREIEEHNLRLLTMDIPSLRKLAREAGARGPVPPQPDETQRVRQAERAEGIAYLPLPDEFRDGDGPEEALDAAFIRKCSRETYRLLVKRYGSAQIDEALRTRRPDASSMW
jgi:hypothetical protein